jgi:hemerythrin
MELLEWNDSYSVGHVLMDAHHRVFFEMIKEFQKLKDKNDRDAIRQRIEFMIEYAAMHFGAEESLMLEANFPDLKTHLAIHEVFTQQALSIKESFEKSPASISGDEVLKLMLDWLINHIMGNDKQYLPYVRKLQDQSA